ncbi:helix-hairpin-helix domain-containing protein [Fulvivirga sp. RKSG066]|uniref:ComEA family DNA-binding protein n=1 Tax=Fulvivirga aurantia TaxID=2529383 RepID=UPI0012BBB439|nr:helix-hairpin-helix domain-containing protein [Fulvivirga aurantia]MTI20641.1 helix-hairpin-helix domain-containing protein [Fulvivirga aurantia]
MRRVAILALILLFTQNVSAQEYPLEELDIQQFVEEIFAFQDEDVSYEELYEVLLLYYSNPIDLNKATREELKSLYVLSDYQLNNFLDYRSKYGRLLSIYELQAVPGLDIATIYKLIPFVTVRDEGLNADNRPLLERILSERNNYLLLRYEQTLETKKGYTTTPVDTTKAIPSRYAGGRGKHYARFRVSHVRDFSLGFTIEKDAGEAYTWDPSTNRYGADFYSFHFQLQNQGRLKDLLVGDYQIQYGQSLLLGAGFNVGKGAETITTVRRSNLGIRPYTSVIESGFFRGAAATYEINKQINLTNFYSRLAQDAIIRSDTLSDSFSQFISSVQSSGFHRTASEISAKNDVVEQNFGGTLLYKDKTDNLQVGMTFIATHFDKPLLKKDVAYNTFEFKGTFNQNIGLFYNYNWQNVSLFGEVARSKSGGIGAVGGMIVSLTPNLESSVVLRNYDKDFHSFYGQSFGESTRNINERGWYWGLKYKPSRKYQFSAYFDQFTFPWLRSNINAPSTGYEYLFRANYKPRKGVLLYAQFRQQSKMDAVSDQEAVIKFPSNRIKRNYVLNLDLKVSDAVSLKSRAQFSNAEFENMQTAGYTIVQDLNIRVGKFRASGRVALFDTDDYENRQYVYERDVLYAFSIPAYSGVGMRHYILAQYGLTKKIDLYARYARTSYRDRSVISSGLEEIEGSEKTDVKFQVRIKF